MMVEKEPAVAAAVAGATAVAGAVSSSSIRGNRSRSSRSSGSSSSSSSRSSSASSGGGSSSSSSSSSGAGFLVMLKQTSLTSPLCHQYQHCCLLRTSLSALMPQHLQSAADISNVPAFSHLFLFRKYMWRLGTAKAPCCSTLATRPLRRIL